LTLHPHPFDRNKRPSTSEGCSLKITAERPVSAGAQNQASGALEAESIGIMREVVAEFRNPAMLYSEIDAELRDTSRSERHGRLIDGDEEAAMERKKREGYF
jgi:3'-phosphoadenosine 5'-phosphosulfate sulfotransferase (PAPS reductase)/FAD synthetase